MPFYNTGIGQNVVSPLTVANANGRYRRFTVDTFGNLTIFDDGGNADLVLDASGGTFRNKVLAYNGGGTPVTLAAPQFAGYISGGAYPLAPVSATQTAIPAVDTLYLWPFFVDFVVTPAQFGLRVVTAGTGSSMKLGIWANNNSTMRPTGTPIMSNNAGVATTSNNSNARGAVTGVPLYPGVQYWMGTKHTGTLPTVCMVTAGVMNTCYRLGLGIANAVVQVTGLSVADAYANDISATSLTSASFTNVTGANMPVYEMVV